MKCTVGRLSLMVPASQGGSQRAPQRRAGLAGRRQPATVVTAFFSRGPNKPDNEPPAAASADTRETLVSDGAIKSLSPEARRIFREAQDNIIELNKSRLRALEELKAARQKIAELEEKLDGAVQEASQASAVLQQLGPGGAQAAAAAGAAGVTAATASTPMPEVTFTFDQAMAQQQQQQQQQAAQASPAQAAQGAAAETITVVYETGWGAAYLHHNADNRGWTKPPGQKMDNGSQQFPDKKVLTVPGRRMEFVINDGGSDWDKPNPYDGGRSNYVVDAPGTYRLKNGKVARLA